MQKGWLPHLGKLSQGVQLSWQGLFAPGEPSSLHQHYHLDIHLHREKLRVQNFRENQQVSKMSDQKRQILISNAFRKLYSTESLSQDQTVEIRLDNSNFDNPPPPTT